MQEDALTALDNKNPAVKAETAAFLSRCFSKSNSTTLNKKVLKAYMSALIKTLNESGTPRVFSCFFQNRHFLIYPHLIYVTEFDLLF